MLPVGRLVGLTLALVVAPCAAAAGCDVRRGSTEVDGGGDLLGVFSRDAGSDAGADAGVKRRARRARDAGAPVLATPGPTGSSTRPPSEGVCVATGGAPDKDVGRTQGRPPCRGAQVVEWKDSEGAPRYACVFAPPGVETRAPLPLVIFFHDEDDDPSAVQKTALPRAALDADMTGDPAHRGFIVLAPQGRRLRGGHHGLLFDTAYAGADAVDLATVDHFVSELTGKGLVDARRVYTLGESLGGHMASLYAMARADKVAAFATYGTDAPPAPWTCAGPPLPGMIVYRACDGFISCDAVERWLRARDDVKAETSWLRLGAANEEEPSCATKNKCTPKRAEGNHHRWPKGREGDVLRFFARHALASSAPPAGGASEKAGPLPDEPDEPQE